MMLSNVLKNDNKYFNILLNWDNNLSKDSIAAGLYNTWEMMIWTEFNERYVPKEVKGLIWMQLSKIIKKLENFPEKDRDEILLASFDRAIDFMIKTYSEDINNWVYGQDEYKHVKIKHPLENVVNDSIYSLIALKTYPRGGNGFTPGSTSFNNNQSSGGSFRVLINTGDWDDSFATNSPGQSGDPKSKFYDNLYEDWANDIYFPLLYSKSKILRNLENRKVYYPLD